jgi:hypothetical protein
MGIHFGEQIRLREQGRRLGLPGDEFHFIDGEGLALLE